MEENKNKEAANKKPAKLTYEQLEAYAAQTTEQAKKLFKENQMLRNTLQEYNLKEIELALRCLDHADKFSPDFVAAVLSRIEEIMNPRRQDKEEPTQEESEQKDLTNKK